MRFRVESIIMNNSGIRKKFPDFKQEVAGSRSNEGWHFDNHPLNGSSENVEHINIYSKEQKFRVHITWRK